MSWRIGVDSGGTFTDVCLFNDRTGQLDVWKVSSTPRDPSVGIAQGVSDALGRFGALADDVAYLGHGTTVATNALIQKRGALTGLITGEGFRDLLEIGRQKRPSLYDMQADKPETLVRRNLRYEVPERIRYNGTVETPLDYRAARTAIRELRKQGVKSIAVCFLYAFVCPEHEQQMRKVIAEEFPDAFISTSHEVAPEFREFERMTTTVLNAYLGPVTKSYFYGLIERVQTLGINTPPHITQSNGGIMSIDQAARLPVRTLLSGPSTGVIAAQAIGRATGIENLITFDMGGTSTDVAVITNLEYGRANVTDVHGYPVKAPMLDIHSIGAGGGSIAHVDTGGLLKVGPDSAGADPGPACYDKGNDNPTVTDANLVLQTLDPHTMLGGRMKLNQKLANKAVETLATKLSMDLYSAAQGIISVVTANMVKAIRVVSVKRGYDPRDYTLVAFGGAGPLHAARLARELDIEQILVPPRPGLLCAIGLLLTDPRVDFAFTRHMLLEGGIERAIEEQFGRLETQAHEWFNKECITTSSQRLRRSIDIRYVGQNYELEIELPNEPLRHGSLETLATQFRAVHERIYGFAPRNDKIQLVTFRLQAFGIVPKATFLARPEVGPDSETAIIDRRDVWLPEARGFISSIVYDRDQLEPGNEVLGPAVIQQMDSSTLLLPGTKAKVDGYLNLLISSRSQSSS
jgi:N-methylhydantoinase A